MSDDPNKADSVMDKLMGEFSTFLNENSNNEEMKDAFDSVVKEVISKDALYEPMK